MPTGLTSQDIQCRKDGLLVETADLLGVSVPCDMIIDNRLHCTVYKSQIIHIDALGVHTLCIQIS